MGLQVRATGFQALAAKRPGLPDSSNGAFRKAASISGAVTRAVRAQLHVGFGTLAHLRRSASQSGATALPAETP